MNPKRCPFCNSNSVDDTCAEEDGRATFYYVFCNKCEASGPTDYDREKAIRLWNRRVEPE